jgi:hypothetical protein
MTSSVNPASAQAIYPSSYSSGISSATGNGGDGSSGSGAVSGHHRHSHGGALILPRSSGHSAKRVISNPEENYENKKRIKYCCCPQQIYSPI